MYVNSCSTGRDVICERQAYHAIFPTDILAQEFAISHLDALNCVVAFRQWATQFKDKLVHLYCNSATAVAMLQAG